MSCIVIPDVLFFDILKHCIWIKRKIVFITNEAIGLFLKQCKQNNKFGKEIDMNTVHYLSMFFWQ